MFVYGTTRTHNSECLVHAKHNTMLRSTIVTVSSTRTQEYTCAAFFVGARGCVVPLRDRRTNGFADRRGCGGMTTDSKLVTQEADRNGKLADEQVHQHDLVFLDVVDSARSAAEKLHKGFGWVTKNIPAAVWVVRVDDGSFVQFGAFASLLLEKFDGADATSSAPRIFGSITSADRSRSVPHSGKFAAYFKDKAMTYPPFPLGSYGFAVTRGVADYVASLPNPFYYQSEDVSLGMWLDQEGAPAVEFEHHQGQIKNDKNCNDPNTLIAGHDLTIRQLQACQDNLRGHMPPAANKAARQERETVSCGGHESNMGCAGCTQGHGAAWCHGDCQWDATSDSCRGGIFVACSL